MKNKAINLLTDDREAWATLYGKRKIFRGRVSRFGHKHRQGAQIKRGATLCLTDVHIKGSNKSIDHVWVDYTVELAKHGELIVAGSLIEFQAVVTAYVKGGKNLEKLDPTDFDADKTYHDLELSQLSNIKVIRHKRLNKTSLIGTNLTAYAIKTRTNIANGVFLGMDPQNRLGKIYVGQNFANKLAKYLSWKSFQEP